MLKHCCPANHCCACTVYVDNRLHVQCMLECALSEASCLVGISCSPNRAASGGASSTYTNKITLPCTVKGEHEKQELYAACDLVCVVLCAMRCVVWTCNVGNSCSQRGAQSGFGSSGSMLLMQNEAAPSPTDNLQDSCKKARKSKAPCLSAAACKLFGGEPAASFCMINVLPDLKYSQHASANGNSSWPLQQSVVLHKRKGSVTELYSIVFDLQTPSWC
jgi:hypothetical protein